MIEKSGDDERINGEKELGKYNRAYFRQDVLYRDRTGLCPVCRERKAKRMTCGDLRCISLWILGYVPDRYQE